jgi:O-antigen/teichoic acid export membrane protein
MRAFCTDAPMSNRNHDKSEKQPAVSTDAGGGSRARVVFKNSGALGISAMLGKAFYFLLFILVGRYLGPSDLGKFTFALSFAGMFAVISDLGLNILAVRDVAQEKDLAGKYLSNMAGLKIISGLLAFAATMLLVNLMGYPKDNVKIVLVIGTATFFTTVSNGVRWLFQAFQKLEYESIVNVVHNFLCLGLGFAAVLAGLGVYGIGYGQILAGMIIVAFSFTLVKRGFMPVSLQIDLDFWKAILKKSVPFALMLVFTGLYVNVDTVLLSKMKGDQVVGLYNAANRMVQAGKMIPAIMLPALFPMMAHISRGSRSEFNRFLEKSAVLLLSLAFPFSVGAAILADKVMDFFYGAKFASSVPCLQILVWGMFCMYVSIVLGYGLICKGKQKINTWITGLGLGVSLILNFSLIPRWGNIGSSVAVLSTEFFVMAAGAFFARKVMGFDFRGLLAPVSKIVAATLIMSLLLFLAGSLHLIICVGIGMAGYFAALFSLGGLYDYDLHKVKNLILARTG